MILSLCSGYAGLDLAIRSVTGQALGWVSDVDPTANRVLAHRFPEVPNLGDLTTYDFAPLKGSVSVLSAGYPCQPFSKSGRRGGTDDRRHLFPHVARAVAQLRPRLVILENVSDHLTLGFTAVLGHLAEIGYDARWCVVPASAVGAPHGRERLFIAATPTDTHGLTLRPTERYQVARQRRTVDESRAASWQLLARHGGAQHDQQVPDGARVDWREFTDAIRRWERLTGQPAPAPLLADESLNPALPEWMMGLESGWVTDVPSVTPPQALHALGNGVCPPQAAYALGWLGVHEGTAA